MKFNKKFLIFVSSFVLCLESKIVESTSGDEENVVYDSPLTELNHLVVHKDDGRVFIGAVNKLFELTPDLKLVSAKVINPTQNTGNYNKILLMDYHNSKLISCWSDVIKGCTAYNTNTSKVFESISEEFFEAVAPKGAITSTVAFISRSNQNTSKNSVLYVGASYSGYYSKHIQIPAVAVRTLENGGNYLKVQGNGASQILFNTKYQDKYIVRYVYGFNSGNYGYFLTTQQNSTMGESPYISKIIRIHHVPGEPLVQGYTEIPVECTAKTERYDLVQAAHVGKPSLELAKSLNITPEDDVLFATFSKSQKINYNEPVADSALCIYSLHAINSKFTENIQNCFNGVGNRGLEFISPNEACHKLAQYVTFDPNSFRSSSNMPIGGNVPISSHPVSQFFAIPTAITSVEKENSTVIFIGTITGHLYTIIVRDAVANVSYLYLNSISKENSSINSDLLLSFDKQHLHIMTKSRITRIKVTELPCQTHTTYDSCLQSNKKSCGWCALRIQCTKKSECPQNHVHTLWLQYDFRKNASITNINSNVFHRTSPEFIQLNIANVPLISEQFYCKFKIGNLTQTTLFTWKLKNQVYNASCQTPSTISTIPQGKNYLKATLQISTLSIPNIASTNITFFDCSTYDSCEKCVSSNFKCGWRINIKKCEYIHTEQKPGIESMVTNMSDSRCPTTNHRESIVDSQSDTCIGYRMYDKCLSRKLSHCGWCRTANICTLRNECSNVTSLSWIDFDIRQLFSIRMDQTDISASILHPKYLQNESSEALQFFLNTTKHLEISKDEFYCKIVLENFNFTFETSATFNKKSNFSYMVSCEAPNYLGKLSVPSSNPHVKAVLSLEMINIPNICNTTIKFFDCNSYNTCEACVSSEFKCQWCPNERICTYNMTDPCTKSTTILVPSGIKRAINIVNNRGSVESKEYANAICLFNIEGKNDTMKITETSGSISCEPMIFEYDKNNPNVTASLTILQKSSTACGMLSNKIIVIYKCQNMAHDCLTCLTLDSKYNCGWCENTKTCEFHSLCNDELISCNGTCPNLPLPSISSIKPTEGPWEGGTNLTILGESLGYTSEDICHGTIKVAGIPCIPYNEAYIQLKKIVCVISKSNISKNLEGPVELKFKGMLLKSPQNFKFVNPKINEVFPKEGPSYGGTEVIITGEHLDAGRSVDISAGNTSCLLISRTSNEMKCITDPSMAKEGEIIVRFDNNIRKSDNSTYKYIKDAERDENGFNIEPKGTLSGGVQILIRNVSFTGTNSSQELQFQVHLDSKTYSSFCKGRNDSVVTCPSPYIPHIDSSSFSAENPMKLEFSLKHATTKVRIVPDAQNNSRKFTLYPDPEFHYFLNSSVKFNEKTYIIIKGRYINYACQKTDIRVEVGNSICNVISLSSYQVVCVLPEPQSLEPHSDIDEQYDILAQHDNITVKIGDNFIKILPKQQVHLKEGGLKIYIIAVIITSMVTLLVFMTSFIIICQKVKAKALEKLMETQQKMDKLELCVAAECKEAFAELQTQITIFTSQNPCNRLPFLDYRSYIINILFPNINDHSYMFYGKAILIHKEHGLQLFGKLIKNKRFLLTFVRTLESNENFSVNDRVYVASMIMITLQEDMEYCTDFLKALVTELIEKYTQGKRHPKLLFRRTESVAEKMLSAWFAFLLYKFLRENAGSPLINLFSAIKQQVNKGPVDMITSDARYCLSENKMIRQKINYCPMTVLVKISEKTATIIKLESAMEKVEVNVLDCDTISQAKEKIMDTIYNTNRYSQRSDPSEICIEWLTGGSDGMILSDGDHTSKLEGELRQINTLGHYGVVDGSTLNLISLAEANHRPSEAQLLKEMNLKNDYICKSPLPFRSLKKKQLCESTIPLIKNNDAHCKEWHLVKPFDSNNIQESYIGSNQIVPEIYLTRLLAMKNSLQKFVNDLFEIILKKKHQKKCFPIAIKYMFDFLDDQALQHGITDPEVLHIWKNNCLPLRFWVNLIKNPNFLFDIHKSNTVDSCLSVIAQVLMDSCSTTELHLNKDSATSKLLYAKEIPFYKKWVDKYYSDINNMSAISSQDMSDMLLKESQTHATDFDTNSSLNELFKYALKFKEELIDALKDDEFAQENLLAQKLEKVYDVMSAIKIC